MKLKKMRPEAIWLMLAATVLVLALAALAAFVVGKHRWAQSTLAQVEPRHARLTGLMQAKTQVEALRTELGQNLGQQVYAAEGDANQNGNDTLQKVRDAADTRGLRVVSSQVMPPREDEPFVRVGVGVRVEGAWPAFNEFLRDLAALSPTVYSESLQVTPQAGNAEQGLNVSGQLGLFVLKDKP